MGQLEKGVQGGGFLYLKLQRVETEKVAWSGLLKEARTRRNYSTELEERRRTSSRGRARRPGCTNKIGRGQGVAPGCREGDGGVEGSREGRR